MPQGREDELARRDIQSILKNCEEHRAKFDNFINKNMEKEIKDAEWRGATTRSIKALEEATKTLNDTTAELSNKINSIALKTGIVSAILGLLGGLLVSTIFKYLTTKP